jgi:hypothetical protein
MNLFTLTPYAPTPRRADALARIAEINEEIKRIDNALDNAQLTWLRSVQSLALDQTYQDGCQQLETLKTALHGEVAVVRMKALL